jgi:hypothetical protein
VQNQYAMDYLSCDCERCKNGIEFPAHGLGRRISCPHCGAPVTLKGAPMPAETVPSARAESQPATNRVSAMPVAESKFTVKTPSAEPPVAADFAEKARKWREERVQWLLNEAKANLPLILQSKMDKVAARKLRDLFEEISDEFEQKARESERIDPVKTESKA